MSVIVNETKRQVSLPIDSLLTLEQAGIPGGAYAMRPIDEKHIQDLMRTDMNEWPAIKVARLEISVAGGKKEIVTVIVDGLHRRKCAKMRGASVIRAEYGIYESENDIVEGCFQANLSHGLKASAETRSDYAYWLHLTYTEMGQKEIAAKAQISQSAVSQAIAKREAALEEDSSPEEQSVETQCKRLSKRLVGFYGELGTVQDGDVIKALQLVIKPGDKAKVAKVAKLLLQVVGQ